MPPLTSALCIHAKVDDLRFLNPVKNRLCKLLNSQIKILNLSDQHSNAAAKVSLKSAKEGFVIILAHGNRNCLRGGEYRSRQLGRIVEVEKFISKEDISVFSGKVVFCMSCDSNGLAQASLDAGALAFVGFDEIPFNRFDGNEPIGSRALVMHCQKLLAESMLVTLERFLIGRSSLDEAVNYLPLWINMKSVEYVRKYTNVKERREVAALLLKVGQGVKYHGILGLRFELN